MDRSQHVLLVVVVVTVVIGAGIATDAAVDLPAESPPNATPNGSANGTANGTAAVDATGSENYADLYNRTIDSVVTVRVRTPRGTSQGSGFVYDDRGHVVTNEHVVGSAGEVMVRYHDGTWHAASVVGTDAYTDLAVLRVRNASDAADPLPVAKRNPRTGRRVAALGSPLGLEGSISSGIVSGVNRSMDTERGFSIPATVQTDAPINPGNSGGPLVSLDGTVVGVNRAKGGDNIGFAISPQLLHRVVPALVERGSYDHPYIGVRSIPVTPIVAAANDVERTRGVMVVGVVDGGPADGVIRPASSRTGVDGRPVPTGGDVVLSVDGTPVTSQQHLARTLMLNTRPGETVPVTVLRDGERRTVRVTLGERPDL